MVLILAVSSCAQEGEDGKVVAISDARLSEASTLELSIAACNSKSRNTRVAERENVVTITVTVFDEQSEKACADIIPVKLSEPLRNRRLIDGSTKRSVNVTPLDPDIVFSKECRNAVKFWMDHDLENPRSDETGLLHMVNECPPDQLVLEVEAQDAWKKFDAEPGDAAAVRAHICSHDGRDGRKRVLAWCEGD